MTVTQENSLPTLTEEESCSVCITLSKIGIQSKHSKDIEDFLPLVEQASIAWVDLIVLLEEDWQNKVEEKATKFGFSESLVRRLLRNFSDQSHMRGGYEDFDTEMGLLIPAIHVKDTDVTLDPLLILLKKNLLLTIHSETIQLPRMRRYAETFFGRLPQGLKQNDWLTLLLIRVIDQNNQRNFMQIQALEECVDGVSLNLSETKYLPSELSNRIYGLKHANIKYISALWYTEDVLSSLRSGDANILSDEPKVLNRIGRHISEIHTQIGIAEHISEVLASGLECLQSIYNNRLQILNNRLSIVNNRITLLMGWLTILGTALLVPNTIATVLSQSSLFSFDQADKGWYLALILGATIIATFLAWLWVKMMGLLPRKGTESEVIPIPAAEKEREE